LDAIAGFHARAGVFRVFRFSGAASTKAATDAGYLHEGLLLKEQPAAYYRTTSDHYRKLLAETTTPGLTQYLREMIARCERLAREIEAV